MENQIKERPILFSAPMVRAILDGRKTVTRRALNAQALKNIGYGVQLGECHELPSEGPMHPNSIGYYTDFCPFGQLGDRLWVRESFWHAGEWVPTYPEDDGGAWAGTRRVHYRADSPPPNEPNHHYPNGLSNGTYSAAAPAKIWRARPSIHMPRWASRILLEITDVRVERLQAISRADIRAEGLQCPAELASDDVSPNYRDWYPAAWRELWESINGTDSWNANPWVWVVEFKQVSP